MPWQLTFRSPFQIDSALMRSSLAGIETNTWLTGYPRSQDPAPHNSVQSVEPKHSVVVHAKGVCTHANSRSIHHIHQVRHT